MFARWRARMAACVLLLVSLTSGSCFLDHEVEPFYGRVSVPRSQEFRWSNGGLPQTFDPALAAAPPETDVVRAMYEGLTEYDPKSLVPVPGVAARWESSADATEWTFHLRRDARWSNGEPVTARHFVESWKRTLRLGDNAPHAKLLENIVGAMPQPLAAPPETQGAQTVAASPSNRTGEKKETRAEAKPEKKQEAPKPLPFGAEVVDDYTLRVKLSRPDASFPALVAHPVFRPVHDTEGELPSPLQAQRLITNGAFQFTRAGSEGVTLERAGNYWDAQAVSLERVQFVPAKTAEAALSAYREGRVDAVTNAGFEPLAVKLLAPYKDFTRATYGALTLYSFNLSEHPFDDVRVREALSIVIDRERICQDEMGGATEPARKFLPEPETGTTRAAVDEKAALEKDKERAQSLLAAAGFPQGKGFPTVRLLINRNEQQRVVAQSIANMWRASLGIETNIIAKNWDEYERDVRAGQYDVVRRGFVMQTTDETTNMRLMFENGGGDVEPSEGSEKVTENAEAQPAANSNTGAGAEKSPPEKNFPAAVPAVSSQAEALRSLPAIPIYFASSYSLVKPYVVGFAPNLLDAPSLKRVRIETGWQPPKRNTVDWLKN